MNTHAPLRSAHEYFMECFHNKNFRFLYLYGFVEVDEKKARVDPDQLASAKASWSVSTLFSKRSSEFQKSYKHSVLNGQIW